MALIEFRSLDWYDPDGVFLEITKGFLMPPATRGEDYVIASAAGRSSGNREADVLRLLAEGYVAGATPTVWRANTDALAAVLDEVDAVPGTLTVRGPLYGLAAGESAVISARVVNAVEGPITAYMRQTWSIELESVDPYWVLVPGP